MVSNEPVRRIEKVVGGCAGGWVDGWMGGAFAANGFTEWKLRSGSG